MQLCFIRAKFTYFCLLLLIWISISYLAKFLIVYWANEQICYTTCTIIIDHTGTKINYYTHLTALFLGQPGWVGTRKVKPIWILLKQETVSGSGISWDICKSAPRTKQITMPAPHHSVFYRPDALPAAQPTVSKQWRHKKVQKKVQKSTILNKYKSTSSWSENASNQVNTQTQTYKLKT